MFEGTFLSVHDCARDFMQKIKYKHILFSELSACINYWKYDIVSGRWLPNLPNQVLSLKPTNVGPDWLSQKEDALPSGQHMILDEIDFGQLYN